ncbi:MAG: glycoside hydrolase family 15 protein [Gemmatimonadaceae bacterium]|nr:glycoside hydrolase family 15 protein [Gemmatimonadaceae bacterium]
MSTTPIADYALLSDCHSAALVSRAGSVDWLCFPRFDSPAVFARLLDDEAGHWSIRPTGTSEVSRRYVDGSLVLETRFETPSGVVLLTDLLAVGENERGHDLGREAPHALLRRVRCESGRVEMEAEFSPRAEYGVVRPLLLEEPGGILARGGATLLRLSSTMHMEIADGVAGARFTVEEGDELDFALQFGAVGEASPAHWDDADIGHAADETLRAWSSWAEMHQSYEGPWAELVHHSGRVLQGLTYYPTGAMIAAATTSLPEVVGGARNWDYRFCWVRDASFTLDALWVAACPDEAEKFFSFLTHAALGNLRQGTELQIMFGIGGEHDLTERELPHLRGWRESRPVRVGNGAWDQGQLDVYGELMAAAERLKDQLGEMSDVTREFLVSVVDAAADRWREPDQGIWEMRGEPRHFLHSKLMCWVALDRGIRMAELLGAAGRIERWTAEREAVRDAILREGWSEAAGAFTQSFGDDALDASALVIPIVGFLPADDPRVLATIDATLDRLSDPHGLVYRYRTDDGMDGEEGSFLLCTFWLAEAQALAGDVAAARATFERVIRFVNDVGLLSEEVDPQTGELIGNFPQAFSHVGLVNAAWAISQAEER